MRTGWLSPSGELVPCSTYEHLSVAEDLCKKIGLSTMVPTPLDELLLNHGWVHISRSTLRITGNVQSVDWRRPLTPEQIRYLAPLFEENDLPISATSRYRWEQELKRM